MIDEKLAIKFVTKLMENKTDELIYGLIRNNMDVDISYIEQVLAIVENENKEYECSTKYWIFCISYIKYFFPIKT